MAPHVGHGDEVPSWAVIPTFCCSLCDLQICSTLGNINIKKKLKMQNAKILKVSSFPGFSTYQIGVSKNLF